MHRFAASLLAEKLASITQKPYTGQVQCFHINNLFEMQQILHEAKTYQIYGYDMDFSHQLGLNTEPSCLENIAWSKSKRKNGIIFESTRVKQKKPKRTR